jgi:hypothetical protein
MSLYDQARSDNLEILTREDGLTLEMTLTNPRAPVDSRSVTIRGRVTDIGMYISPETGLPISARSMTVAFSTSEVSSISLTNESYKDWTFDATFPNGEAISARLLDPMPNRTLGYVHSFAREIA